MSANALQIAVSMKAVAVESGGLLIPRSAFELEIAPKRPYGQRISIRCATALLDDGGSDFTPSSTVRKDRLALVGRYEHGACCGYWFESRRGCADEDNRKYAWIDISLIQGVHAETITFSSYEDACELALTPGWPWLGAAGLQGTREVELGGARRRFRLRVSEAQARGHTTACTIELLELDRLFTLRIRVALTLQPNNSGTRLTVSGLVVRDLAGDPNGDPESSRHLANEYVRSLIEQVAKEIERLKGRSEVGA